MGVPLTHEMVEAFFEAYSGREISRIGDFLTDDVDWRFIGPVDVFPFCGERHGKDAVVTHLTKRVPSVFSMRRLQPEETIIDGDKVALFSMVTAVQQGTGRIMTYHCAFFITFRDGKVCALTSIADTFSVIEQMIGPRCAALMPLQSDETGNMVTL